MSPIINNSLLITPIVANIKLNKGLNRLEDRRKKKTRKAIHEAFINLLKQYDIETITIQQIADEADINRATFYKHYEDKYILLNTIEDNEVNHINQYMNYQQVKETEFNNQASLNQLVENIPKNIMKTILNNIELYEVLFKMNRVSTLENKMADVISNNLKMALGEKDSISNIQFRYFHAYVSGAMINIIKLWVLDEQRISADQLTETIFDIAYHGPLKLILSEMSHATD